MPLVRIEMWAGVSTEVKRNVVKGVTDAIVNAVKCPVQAVEIIITENPKENWAVGGQFFSDTHKDVK